MAAAKLMRIPPKTFFTQAQPAEKIQRIFTAASGEAAVRFQNVFHLRADANEGMKAQGRLLRNTSNGVSADAAQRSNAFAHQFAAFQTNGARLPTIGGQQAKNRPRHSGFASAGWAGERHRFAAVQQ